MPKKVTIKESRVENNFVFDLILILLFTNIFGSISSKFKQPAVLGQILAGLIIGPAILNLVKPSSFISEFSEIGVILLMFMAGMETNIDDMKKSAGSATVIALSGMLVPLILGFVTIKFLYSSGGAYQALYTGVILTATSISITVQTLREFGKLKDKTGVNIIGAAIADDVGGIILLTLVVGMSDPSKGASPLIIILKVIIFFILAAIASRGIKRFMAGYSNRIASYITPSSIALICCLIFAYSASLFEVANIIGAYAAGLVFSVVPNNQRIEHEINTICSTLFTPVFFANIGLAVNIVNIGEIIIPAIVINVVAIIGKITGGGLGAKLLKFSNQESIQIGVGMVPRGEVAIITANLGKKAEMINDEIFTSIIIMSIFTSVVTPVLLKKVYSTNIKGSEIKSSNSNEQFQYLEQIAMEAEE